MGRKRIILEIEEDLNLLDQLKNIETKVAEIQKKQNPAWVIPMVLLLLTSLMTYVNYRFQRHYVNTDIYKNKLKEKIAELRATSTVDFLKRTKETLDTIDLAFESYCLIGKTDEDNNTINNNLIQINSIINHQLSIDTSLAGKIRIYTEFVSAKMIDTEVINKKHLSQIYNQSARHYKIAKEKIDATLNDLTL